MTLDVGGVTLDCSDPGTLATFWSAALGYEVDNDYGSFIFLRDPSGRGLRIGLQAVSEGKAGKNRAHLDLRAADRDGEVERLVGLGARVIDRHRAGDFEWVVLADPEGNEFCVAPSE